MTQFGHAPLVATTWGDIVLTKTLGVYLETTDGPAPEASRQLEQRGFAHLPQLFDIDTVEELRRDLDRVFDTYPPDVRVEATEGKRASDWTEFRYETLNRSPIAQRIVADRRILDIVEPLLGEDCHVIANTTWRNPANTPVTHGGGNWHIDSGPHVPRPEGTPWPDHIPYPVFAIACHVLVEDMPRSSGPTGVIPGSHRSGRYPPLDRLEDDDLSCDGETIYVIDGKAGDVVLFCSDIWHRRTPPTGDEHPGRYFMQIHYGRRDVAQRMRPTAEANHLSEAAIARAKDAPNHRHQTVIGLHRPGFYDG